MWVGYEKQGTKLEWPFMSPTQNNVGHMPQYASRILKLLWHPQVHAPSLIL